MSREPPIPHRIANALERQIRSGVYAPGDKLPSLREVARLGNYGKNSVVAAFERLVARGLAEPRRGAGYYVRQVAHEPAKPRDMTASMSRAMNIVWLLQTQLAVRPGQLAAGDAFPPSEWLEDARIDRAHHKLRSGLGSMFRYGDRLGYPPLRRLLAKRLGHLGIQAEADHFLLTHGANEAMDLIVRYFVPPGAVVLTDDPGYYPLLGKLQLAGAHVAGVPRLADGPDLAALEQLLQRWRPRLFFTQSVMQNPTGTDLSPAKAQRLLQLAEQYDLRIVENDALADLRGGPSTRLSALDQLARTIYLGTFSKSLSAALRVGFVAASEEVIEGLADLRSLATVSGSEYCERTVETLLRERHHGLYLARLQQRLREATGQAHTLLQDLGAELFAPYEQSLFLWARFAQMPDALELARQLQPEHIVIAPGALFAVDGKAENAWARYNAHAVLQPRFAQVMRTLLRQAG
jgi:DNA-binding transcriptional MocR family regulator